jgi:aconitate hydratase
MVELLKKGAYLIKGQVIVTDADQLSLHGINNQRAASREAARANTITYQILNAHNTSGDWRNLKLRFDSLASHDITYVGIIQTACASGLKEFPVPYVLTNCHNSLCAVGGTINEDDHVYGLSAARKYGGIFVPAHQAVIHQYMREMMAGCGKMILGSDSHTRYGALGTIAIGEGGPELVKQLLTKTYDIAYPEVVAVYLDGRPVPGVGPQDVALAIIGAVFKDGFVKNKVLEFVGPGVNNLSVDFRNGIDVMTTETACLSSIWRTDEKVLEFYRLHGRPDAYHKLEPGEVSYYDGIIKVDVSRVEPMIALPFHPSNVWLISELNQNAVDILREVEVTGRQQLENPNLEFRLTNKVVNGRLKVDQGIVAGCAGGTFENIAAMAQIVEGKSLGADPFALSIYPASQPVNVALLNNRSIEKLMIAGAVIRTAFCGPCFGAGDVPANHGLSIRHTTRNFPNREGSRPVDGQIASVALMDARSIAATALNKGILTPATEVDFPVRIAPYQFNREVYDHRVYQGFGKAQPEERIIFGPNIAEWPEIRALPNNLLLKVASVIQDAVTTTDELIPSGEASSYRSNPLKLAEFTLSRKDPGYVGRAKAIQALEIKRQTLPAGLAAQELGEFFRPLWEEGLERAEQSQQLMEDTGIGSVIFAVKPGDGSAREQAASSQRMLGGDANIAIEYATKRYRSNLINWGMLPFTIDAGDQDKLAVDDYLYIPGIRQAIQEGAETVTSYVINANGKTTLALKMENLSQEDRDIILTGCLMNYYAN